MSETTDPPTQTGEPGFEALLENLPGMAYRCDNDRQWTMRFVSGSARSLTGYEPRELVGNGKIAFADLIHPEDRERVRQQVQQAIRADRRFQVEYRLFRKDGTQVWIWEQGRSVDGEPGESGLMLEGLMLDVSRPKQDQARAKEAAEHLEAVGDNLPHGAIYRLQRSPDGKYRFTYASRGVEQVLGIRREQMLADAKAVFALTETPFDREIAEANEQSARDLSVVDMELPQRLPDGRRTWIAVRSMPHRRPNGWVEWSGVVLDITERKRAELETLEVRARLETALASMSDAVMISDADGNLLHMNEAFASFHRFARLADCPGRIDAYPNLLEVCLADGTPASHSQWPIPRALNGETAVDQIYRLRRKDSGESWIGSYNLSPIHGRNAEIIGAVVTGRDVTRERAHQAELDRIAHHDPLTGLPNRRLLSDRLEQAIALADRTGRSLAVCYLDLDGFKPINDRYGHEVGDQYLIRIGEVLRENLRGHDSVARLGGDEFAIVLTQLQRPDDCFGLLERVLNSINQPVTLAGAQHRATASIGVTLYPADRCDPDVLLRHADHAMYAAKQSGKNRYHLYDAEQEQSLQRRRRIRDELSQALEHDTLVLHFQPQVDLINREVIGAEALIRLQHPSQGLLPPAHFLPEIANSPLEPPLSDWVIENVLSQLERWNRQGLRLRIGINVSAGQLMAPRFAARLQEQLERHPAVAPDQIEIEVLESTAFDDFEEARRVLSDCHALGVRFALDDFGTGYSSLAYFRTLPVDVLKIDQSFVRDMLDDPGDRSIVESVVKLSQAFKRSVIAEGIETRAHAALVNWLGCRYGQGYGIARPMPADELPGWISGWAEQNDWSDSRFDTDRDEIQLMIAAQDHLYWFERVIHAVNHLSVSDREDFSPDHCAFGSWYSGPGGKRLGQLDGYRALGKAHQHAHAVAGELLALAAAQRSGEAQARLGELRAARNALIDALSKVVDGVRPDAPLGIQRQIDPRLSAPG